MNMYRPVFKVILLGLIFILNINQVHAAKPGCSEQGYCSYRGKVKQLYVNSTGLILLYFDTVFDPSEASIVSKNVIYGFAAAVPISENPEFAKLFYSTALSANLGQRNVSIQMRGEVAGYLKIDRIWLE
ncbi:hypothetical protein [Shewanella algae]|uniref:hypothetical protein n=1 Tax=Shewanella algae TaxID=38313 RepID=UPI003007EC1C